METRTVDLGMLALAPCPVERRPGCGVVSGLWRALRLSDPRNYQIVALTTFLILGVLALEFPITFPAVACTVVTALLVQAAGSLSAGLRFEPRSALITSLSLLLILRTGHPATMGLAAALAVGSKFVFQRGGQHLFNPANFGIVVAVLLTGDAWISPGQWGSASLLLLLFAGLGLVVTTRAQRADITLGFLAFYALVLFGRALWLGDPMAIPLRSLQSGTLLLFAFFMLSDPRTTPSSRLGRLLFAGWVAVFAGWIQFSLHRPNAFLWALAVSMPLVPLLNRCLPAQRFTWRGVTSHTWGTRSPREILVPSTTQHAQGAVMNSQRHPGPVSRGPCSLGSHSLGPVTRAAATRGPGSHRRRPVGAPFLLSILLSVVVLASLAASAAQAFCGFYVAKADTGLFNKASEVVLVRDGQRTVITMSNDFRGDLTEFAMVIPVPTVLEEGQIHVAERALIDHLDAYTSPRLVEYFDPDPCARRFEEMAQRANAPASVADGVAKSKAAGERDLGVTIEATYTVGEYDILILSAEQSDGLETWLRQNGYRLPKGASAVLGSYIRQNVRFFVAKVNLDQQARLGFTALRPLQIAFESPKFMLPIRLGTLNADGDQELFVYTLTRNGRVETTNYRTVRLPTGDEVPTFIQAKFGDFYRDMFARQVAAEPRGVFLEYAWDMGWCDPCAADPLSSSELRSLGVWWVDDPSRSRKTVAPQGGAQDVFVTRLHLRYNAQTFPEDLRFQETADRSNFQGRYVLRHAWRGEARCPEAQRYTAELNQRLDREARTLAHLTGWKLSEIERLIDRDHRGVPRPNDGTGRSGEERNPAAGERWWERLWPGRRR